MQPLSTLSASIEHPLKHAGDQVESSHFFDARLLVGGKEESLHAAGASPALRASGREEGYIKKRRMGKAANDIRLKKKKKKKKNGNHLLGGTIDERDRHLMPG